MTAFRRDLWVGKWPVAGISRKLEVCGVRRWVVLRVAGHPGKVGKEDAGL